MKKLILLGLILAAVTVGIPAAYALGPRVTRVTPYSGIPKYAHMNETYQGELVAGAWGIETADHGVIGRSVLSQIIESSGKAIDKTVGLVVGPGKLKYVAAVAIQAGLLLGQDYFAQWLQQQALQLTSSNPVQIIDPSEAQTTYPNGLDPAYLSEAQVSGIWVDATGLGVGSFSSVYSNTFYNYVRVIAPLGEGAQWCIDHGYPGSSGGVNLGWSTTYWSHRENIRTDVPTTGKTTNDVCMFAVNGAVGPNVHPLNEMIHVGVAEPLTEEEMRSRIEAAFGVPAQAELTNKLAQGSMAAVAPSVNSANKSWPAAAPSYSGTALSPSQGSTVQQALDDSITDTQKAELNEGAQRQAGDSDWEYTPEEMAAAQYQMDKKLDEERKAEYDSYNNATPSYDTNMNTPEKDLLTPKLNSFMAFITGESSPISTLQSAGDVTISGGSCVIDADLGDWGTMHFSFCEWGSSVETLGSVMLMMCSFLWLAWFFMGRGDA